MSKFLDKTGLQRFWSKAKSYIDGKPSVTSFNGRGGIVTPQNGDYTATQTAFNSSTTELVSSNVQGAIEELFTYASNGKELVASAVTGKGVETSKNDSWEQIRNNILSIQRRYEPGVDWFETQLPSSGLWYSATYGDEKFVAVSDNGKAIYSTDGKAWSNATLPVKNIRLRATTYGDGKFVAVGLNGTIVYSTDGIRWESAISPVSIDFGTITYGNGKFVAVTNSLSSNSIIYSYNGIDWESTDTVLDTGTHHIVYGKGIFVLSSKGTSSSDNMYSYNGINWNIISGKVVPKAFCGMAYGNGKFVAPRDSKSIAYSEDGINWEVVNVSLPSLSYSNKGGIAYGSEKFIVISTSDHTKDAAYSTDAITWNPITLPVEGTWDHVAAYGDGTFVALSYSSSTAVYSSTRG